MAEQQPEPGKSAELPKKKPYSKPQFAKHGTLEDLKKARPDLAEKLEKQGFPEKQQNT